MQHQITKYTVEVVVEEDIVSCLIPKYTPI